MKPIKYYLNKPISEKLKITNDDIENEQLTPKTKGELVNLIQKIVSDTDDDTVYLEDIDCSYIEDLSDIFIIVDVPSYIKKINVSNWKVSNSKNFEAIFSSLYAIDEIIGLDTWDMSSATNINNMFYNCLKLKKLHLPWNLKNIGTDIGIAGTTLKNVFYQCKNLEEITGLDTWDMSKIESIASLFFGCENIKKIDISDWDLSSCRKIVAIFKNCLELEEVDMSNVKLTRNFKHFTFGFEGCTNLHTIKGLSDINVNGLMNIVNLFKECKSLKADISNWNINISCSITCAFMRTNSKIFKKPNVFKKK